MFDVISIVVLAVLLLTAIGGILLQWQNLLSMEGGMRSGMAESLMQPESTRTSPTGNLAVTTGIILLLIGFGVIVLMLLVRRWLAIYQNADHEFSIQQRLPGHIHLLGSLCLRHLAGMTNDSDSSLKVASLLDPNARPAGAIGPPL